MTVQPEGPDGNEKPGDVREGKSVESLRQRIRRAGSVRPPAPTSSAVAAAAAPVRSSSLPPPIDTSGVRKVPSNPPTGGDPLDCSPPFRSTSRTSMGMHPVAPHADEVRDLPADPQAKAESATTQLLPRAGGPRPRSSELTEHGRKGPRRPAPHPASVRPPSRTGGSRYSLNDAGEELVVSPRRLSSMPPLPEGPGDLSKLEAPAPRTVDREAKRRARARSETPVERPKGRRSSPPPTPPAAPRLAAATRQQPAPLAETRQSRPRLDPRSEVPRAAQPPTQNSHARSDVPRVPRVRPPVPAAESSLPSVVLDPGLEQESVRLEASRASVGRRSWAEAETALIPRSALEPPPSVAVAENTGRGAVKRASFWMQPWALLGSVGVIALLLLGAVWLTKREQASAEAIALPPVAATPRGVPAAAVQHPHTVIVSQPPGAQLVFRGAVVGNTPTRVARPDFQQLYLLRLPGFEPQLVRISPDSGDQIRIAMQPVKASPTQAADNPGASAAGPAPAP